MVKLESWFLDEIRGSIKGHTFKTYEDKRGVVRVDDPSPSYTRTEAQDKIRSEFKRVKDEWNALSEAEKEGWRVKSVGSGLTGYQYYIKQNFSITVETTKWGIEFLDDSSYLSSTTLGSLGSNLNNTTTIELEFKTTETNIRSLFGTYNDVGDRIILQINRNFNLNNEPGKFRFATKDSNDDDLKAFFSDNSIIDGNIHKLKIVIDSSNSEVNAFVDGEEKVVNYKRQQNPSNFSNFEYPLTVFGRNVRGDIGEKLNGVLKSFYISNNSLGDVVNYTIDEGSGTTVYDDSGNGFDGNLEGDTNWVEL